MSEFKPYLGMSICIDNVNYGFMPHPIFEEDDDEVYVIEGAEALTYRLRNLTDKTVWALKVMKPAYRAEQLLRIARALVPYQHIAGLSISKRTCLNREKHGELIAEFPDLQYATLMPWLSGKTWAGLLLDEVESAQYSPYQALDLALATARVLWDLEEHQLAHTDIAGGNIILSPNFKQVELIDIEGLYIHGAPAPKWRSQGSPGYQHHHLDERGQYCAEGDRFAGAILLTEMLTWWNPEVRAWTPDNAESLFQPHELQIMGTPTWHAVRDTLWAICPPVLSLFDQAWASRDLAQCPDCGTWAVTLFEARQA